MDGAENHAGHKCRVVPLVQCDQQKADRRECRHTEQNWQARDTEVVRDVKGIAQSEHHERAGRKYGGRAWQQRSLPQDDD